MNPLYKRLLWVLFIILALLTTIAAYVGRNFIGIGPVPVRSAFAGRLPSTLDGDQRRFQFFYSTNRENSDETFNERGNILSDTLTRGTFDTIISPYMQIVPFVWFDAAHIKWAGRQELPQETFIPKLREAVQNSPQKSLLVIVWGFRDWFQSAALKTAYTAYILDINTPVLLFDWPGNQGEGFRGYADSQQVATKSAPDLGRILAEVLNETGAEHIWLMGSSLGCQTICDALVWMSDEPSLIKDHHKLDHVVLSAPDVSANAFNDKFAEVIQKLSNHLTAYVSSNDRALLMSHWVNGKRRLGRTAEVSVPPEERKSQYEFEEALELLDLQEKGVREIAVVDATPINRLRNLHHFFTDSPVFFDDLYQRLLQPEDIVSRRLHSVRTQANGPTYWILWND
jgi:esterase/lipase superfamily enzyme